jgi:hypothetical protein
MDYKKTIRSCFKAYVYIAALCFAQFFTVMCINYCLGLGFNIGSRANTALIIDPNYWMTGIVVVIIAVPIIAIIKPSLLFSE